MPKEVAVVEPIGEGKNLGAHARPRHSLAPVWREVQNVTFTGCVTKENDESELRSWIRCVCKRWHANTRNESDCWSNFCCRIPRRAFAWALLVTFSVFVTCFLSDSASVTWVARLTAAAMSERICASHASSWRLDQSSENVHNLGNKDFFEESCLGASDINHSFLGFVCLQIESCPPLVL